MPCAKWRLPVFPDSRQRQFPRWKTRSKPAILGGSKPPARNVSEAKLRSLRPNRLRAQALTGNLAACQILANLFLAGIVWATLLVGRPFALQYARKGLPQERWNDPKLIDGCRFITLIWASLMTVSVCISVYRRTSAPQASEQVYFAMSLGVIAGGVIFTTLFKRQKRLQREK